VVGATFSIPPYAALVAKLDSSGNLQWQKQYQSSIGSSALYALSQTSDGGYVWAGYLQDSSTYAEYAIVTKLIPVETSSGRKRPAPPNMQPMFGRRRTEGT
jgi:hypothetical protein